jgi:hypothetical protein
MDAAYLNESKGLPWVKLRRTQSEQMSSGLPLKADIAQYSRHVSKVPKAVIRSPHRHKRARAHSGTTVSPSDSMFQTLSPNFGLEGMSMSGKCRYPLRITTRPSPTGGAITLCRHIF